MKPSFVVVFVCVVVGGGGGANAPKKRKCKNSRFDNSHKFR